MNRGEAVCDICGKRFVRVSGSQKRCSPACSQAANKAKGKERTRKYRARKPRIFPPRDIVCIKCGKVFSGKSNQKICRECLKTRKDCKKYLDARSDRFAIGGAYERGDF
jgi:hypothetical protein